MIGALGVAVVGVAVAVVVLMNQKVPTLPVVGATDRPATFAPVTEQPAVDFTTPPEEITARLGEAITIIITDTQAEYGTVAVLAGKRYTKVGDYLVADKGKAWIGARVRYVASASFDFNLFDWVAHDDKGNQYQPSGYALDPQLSAGTLAKGRKAEGWVPFDVPAGTKALWADYAPAGGRVIFSVKVYPAK